MNRQTPHTVPTRPNPDDLDRVFEVVVPVEQRPGVLLRAERPRAYCSFQHAHTIFIERAMLLGTRAQAIQQRIRGQWNELGRMGCTRTVSEIAEHAQDID